MSRTGRLWLRECLAPNYCVLCRFPTHSRLTLCTDCLALLPANHNPCLLCALPLSTPGASYCGRCLVDPPPWRRAHIPWLYDTLLAALIARWKYGGQYWLSPTLGQLWSQEASDRERVDALVPVPLHWLRALRRGYNQAELLALGMANATDSKARPHWLHRHRRTPNQRGLSAMQRNDNLRGAFRASPAVAGLDLALVDDVVTTGSTARAATEALLQAGAGSVELWCLARTPTPCGRSID